ncbi:Katanin p60 ATPase-containing subunit A1 [Perkinsus chesapeaki]|uniref:Katanin p60 ATPase-containing subunit A1 n=1 Tax=Perkinsus chesapeaki TaxID=330153 RepID=A0A7J6N3U1_PERCH|nr:Katanin p60 ATPase-containing subunit A1 [Perkinsus chesapeaki]
MAQDRSQCLYSAVSEREDALTLAHHSLLEGPERTTESFTEFVDSFPGSALVGSSLVVSKRNSSLSVLKHGTSVESWWLGPAEVAHNAYPCISAEKLSVGSERFLTNECGSSETCEVDALIVSLNGLRLLDSRWVVGWILAVDPTSVLGSARYSYGLRATFVIHGYCCPVLVDVPRSSRNGLDDVVGASLPEVRWEMDCNEPGLDILEQFLRFMVAELVGVSVKLSKWKKTEPDRVIFERMDVLLK